MQLSSLSAIGTNAEALVQAHAQTQAQAQAAGGTSGSSTSTANSVGSLTSEQTFLQLLVAQIQNQDPLNPTDSIQFVGQLVQYSELEQLMGINQGIQTLTGDSTSSTPSSSTKANAQASPTNPVTRPTS
jgi:flagellar basal-body rod modification protein FlgD